VQISGTTPYSVLQDNTCCKGQQYKPVQQVLTIDITGVFYYYNYLLCQNNL